MRDGILSQTAATAVRYVGRTDTEDRTMHPVTLSRYTRVYYAVRCQCGGTMNVCNVQAGLSINCAGCKATTAVPALSHLKRLPSRTRVHHVSSEFPRRRQFTLAELLAIVTLTAVVLAGAMSFGIDGAIVILYAAVVCLGVANWCRRERLFGVRIPKIRLYEFIIVVFILGSLHALKLPAVTN